jgi:uncharacterized membrane protein
MAYQTWMSNHDPRFSKSLPPRVHRTAANDSRWTVLLFLSDAIMAIAMTLLFLEFKVPPLGKDKTWRQFIDLELDKLRLPALALLLTFFHVGTLWTGHHRPFEHVVDYNNRLIRTHLRFLFLS